MSFRKPQYCMAYMVLAVSLVGGIYIICRDYLAFVFLWERITVLPFRYFFMMAFLFLCAFICMGVAFFQQYFTAQSNQQTGALVLCGCFARSAVCRYVTGTGVEVASAGAGRSAVHYPVPFLLSGRSDTERYSGRETG